MADAEHLTCDLAPPSLEAIGRQSRRHSQKSKPMNPLETVEVPGREGEPDRGLILDEYKNPGVDFVIGDSKHGLLLVIEVFKSEMEYGAQVVLSKLKEKGYYPYSDLDREPVI
ncbi:MAG: hypothetical protein P8189_24425 [Anaerolineae bacterium]